MHPNLRRTVSTNALTTLVDTVENSVNSLYAGRARRATSYYVLYDSPESGLMLVRLGFNSIYEEPESPPPVADQTVVQSAGEQLQVLLRQIYLGERTQREQLADAHRATRANAESRLKEKADAINKYIQARQGAALTRDQVLQRMQELETTRQSLALELVGLTAHQEALENRIAATAQKVTADNQKDPVLQELYKMLRSNEQQEAYLRRLVESGQASHVQLEEARIQQAETRMRIAQRNEELAKSAGGDILPALNQELASIAVKLADVEARLQHVLKQQQAIQSEKRLEQANEYERLLIELRTAEKVYSEAVRRAEDPNMTSDLGAPPTVELVSEP